MTDEEDKQILSDLCDRLQKEVRELRDKTELDTKAASDNLRQEIHSNATSIGFLQNEVRDLQAKFHASEVAKTALQDKFRVLEEANTELHDNFHVLEEVNTELQDDINQLKQLVQPTNTSSSSSSPVSIFQRNFASQNGLPQDTFTLMMTSSILSQAWLLGIFTFAFQMVLIFMIGADQIQESVKSSDFNIPFKVEPIVRAGQLFTIIFALTTQNDITSSIRFLIMFRRDPHWDRTVLGCDEGSPRPSKAKWVLHILIPNIFKFLQGLFVILVTFVVIIQSDNIIDLLKDFTALMVVSETDNIFFGLAVNGYLGSNLQRKTIQIREVKIEDEVSISDSNANLAASPSASAINKDFYFRPVIVSAIAFAMFAGWLAVVIGQVKGKYFYQRYPDCNMADSFQLAKVHFGDGICYGGALNSMGCEFEGGDCVNFNLAFPLCKGEDRINVEQFVGNGKCDEMFMNADCDYDGGDCCPYEITDNPSFGDGLCNAGKANTVGCLYDNGDCNDFRLAYPNCPLEDLSEIQGANDLVLGNSVCDSGIYNIKACGYKFGDCNHGQVGQTVRLTDDTERIKNMNDIYFSNTLSLDGTTVAFGLYATNEEGDFNPFAPGKVKIFRYDSTRKMWLQLGRNIFGDFLDRLYSEELHFGRMISMSSTGNRIAISSKSGLSVFNFNITSRDGWSQVGQTLIFDSDERYDSNGIMASDGSRVALVDHSSNSIRIYDLQTTSTGLKWVNDDHNVIDPGMILSHSLSRTQLRFNSLDGSWLLLSTKSTRKTDETDISTLTKVYQFSQNATLKSWTQVGNGIPYFSPSATISEDGSRIAVPSNFTSTDAPGQVHIFDYDVKIDEWVPVGIPIKSSSPRRGDGFGSTITMSSDGNLLAIGSNTPGCQPGLNFFEASNCTKGSVELYNYQPYSYNEEFQKVIPNNFSPYKANGHMLDLANLLLANGVFGLHFSMKGDGTSFSISGYNLDDQNAFVQVFDLNELFYTRCIFGTFDDPKWMSNGFCDDRPPFNTEACGFDGGDCSPKPVEGYPNCFVDKPENIGDEKCHDKPPYNTEDCGIDGGDCIPKPVEGYPDCFVKDPDAIGDGWCDDWLSPEYNTEACGFDGGDCL